MAQKRGVKKKKIRILRNRVQQSKVDSVLTWSNILCF